jgi:hypothetical protein
MVTSSARLRHRLMVSYSLKFAKWLVSTSSSRAKGTRCTSGLKSRLLKVLGFFSDSIEETINFLMLK